MNNIRIAIQSKGRLASSSEEYLSSLGIEFESNGRNYRVNSKNLPVEIIYLRDDDIPEYVEFGVVDFGIIGENVLNEKRSKVRIVRKLGFSKCSLVIAVPEDSSIRSLKDLEGERIATSYPKILRKFLRSQGIHAVTVLLKGSVEIAPSLCLADAVFDLVQSGETLRENNLKPLFTVMESQAVLIQNPFLSFSL